MIPTKITTHTILALFLIFLVSVCRAETRIILVAAPPFAYIKNSEPAGLGADLLQAMSKRLNKKISIEIVPANRAVSLLETTPNVLSFLVRLPIREHEFIWLGEVIPHPCLLYVRADASDAPQNLTSARVARIGVMRGSFSQEEGRLNGFTHLDEAPDEESNARKLFAGRIQGWIGDPTVIEETVNRLGMSTDKIKVISKISDYKVWFLASPGTAPQDIVQWRMALDAIKLSGELKEIASKYGYN